MALGGPARAGTASVEDTIRGLASKSEKVRFDSAVSLIDDPAESLGPMLLAARGDEPFRSPGPGRAALDFVIERRSGKGSEPAPKEGASSGIVLVSIDTLRADHLGCYGYGRPTTPVIDSLARQGVRFEHAISPASWTLPAHMSLLTSLYPSFHKLEKGGRIGSVKLDPSETTLAEILKAAGYATAGFVANPFLDASWGFGRGFDVYSRSMVNAESQSRLAARWIDWHGFQATRGLAPAKFFLFVHFIDPHEPYTAPPEYSKPFVGGYTGKLKPTDRIVKRYKSAEFDSPRDLEYVTGLYDGEVRFVDESLETILAAIGKIGATGTTTIVVTADHGEEFKDHDSMGHKQTLYDEEILVPLVISSPARIAPGQVLGGQVSLLDVAPTLIGIAGQKAPPKMQGISLLPFVRRVGDESPPESLPSREIFSELGPFGADWEGGIDRRAIRTQHLKLILSYTSKGLLSRELYALDSDPGEETNLYESRKDDADVKALEKDLVDFIRKGEAYNPGFRKRNRITPDEEMLEKLRSLGYIDG